MPTKWNDIVKKTFADGRKTNPAYSLKNAMKDAKPIYKSIKKGVVAATDFSDQVRPDMFKIEQTRF